MRQMHLKWRLILRPFLLTAISSLIAYSLLDYFFFVRSDSRIDEQWYLIWLPILFSALPVSLFLRKGFQTLEYRRANGAIGMIILTSLFMGAATSVAQHYLHTAAGRLTTIPHPSSYDSLPPTRYYDFREIATDQNSTAFYGVTRVSGKGSQDYDMMLYCVTPLFDNELDSGRTDCRYWFCHKYMQTVSNRQDKSVKDSLWEAFKTESEARFDTLSFISINFYERLRPNRDIKYFKKALALTGFSMKGEPVFFRGHQIAFEDRAGNFLLWTLVAFAAAFILVVLMIGFLPLKETATGAQSEAQQP